MSEKIKPTNDPKKYDIGLQAANLIHKAIDNDQAFFTSIFDVISTAAYSSGRIVECNFIYETRSIEITSNTPSQQYIVNAITGAIANYLSKSNLKYYMCLTGDERYTIHQAFNNCAGNVLSILYKMDVLYSKGNNGCTIKIVF